MPRALAVGAAVALAIGAAGQALAAAPASAKAPMATSTPTAAGSKQFHLKTTLSGVSFQGESQLSNGDYSASWKTPSETVKVAAPSGSTVILTTPTANSAGVAVALPSGGTKPTHVTADLLRPASAIVTNAVAVGFTPTQAQALIPGHGIQPFYTVGQILETPCVSVTGDSGSAWGRACDTQKFVQDNGGANWVVGDQIVGSGNDPGSAALSNLKAWVSYGPNNSIINWSPNATVSVGGCTNWTAGLTYSGLNLSASTTICSDRVDPYDAGGGTQFGSSWSGCDVSNYTEGVAAVDVDNNPSNASFWVTLNIYIGWTAQQWWGGC
jgi:hypothetical protein